MDALTLQLVSTGAASVCAGIGSVHDLRERRIPNALTGPAIVAGLALHTATGGFPGMGDAAAAGAIAGAAALLFRLAGGMGAGDVKLMAAVGCIAGFAPLRLVLVATAFAGAIFAIAVSLRHRRLRSTLANAGALLEYHSRHGLRPHPDFNLDNPAMLRLPFALPIAAGCLFALFTLAREVRK